MSNYHLERVVGNETMEPNDTNYNLKSRSTGDHDMKDGKLGVAATKSGRWYVGIDLCKDCFS